MRFRTKFGAHGIILLAVGCLAPVLAFSSPYRSAGLIAVAIGLFGLSVDTLLRWVFVYWDTDDACLRIRHYRKRTEIAWRDILRVREWNPKQPSTLAIDYARSDAASRKGIAFANPLDREGFIAALKTYAPQASFELESGQIMAGNR